MSLHARILEELSSPTPLKARELATRLGIDVKEINPELYRLSNKQQVVKDAQHRWSIVLARNTKGTVAAFLSEPSGRKPERGLLPGLHPAIELTRPGEMKWTEEQTRVISAPPDARIFVEAGPGTGKTAVACERVAKLLKKDQLSPGSILMVSFTRTAVAEMRARLRRAAGSSGASSVGVMTLDQAAFSFGIGTGTPFESMMGSFEGNIERALGDLEGGNALLIEFLRGIRHFIVDEAQDLTGKRSALVRLMIRQLGAGTGVTIFADPEQSIYGFTTDNKEGGEAVGKEYFLEAFEPEQHGFRRESLTQIHRTKNAAIATLFAEARGALRSGGLKAVLQVARQSGELVNGGIEDLKMSDEELILYRTRAAALMQVQFYPGLLRLRLPDYPAAVYPWIALMFADWSAPRIDRATFAGRWEVMVPPALSDGFDAGSAWELLMRFCKHLRIKTEVDLSRLVEQVARPRPRVEFCYLDYGSSGPVFSTIHASKGREADGVTLMLSRFADGNSLNPLEEARVYYVAITRVSARFRHGAAQNVMGAGRLGPYSQRTVHIGKKRKWPKFQVGLKGDFDDVAAVGQRCLSDEAASAHQAELLARWLKALSEGICPELSATFEETMPGAELYRFTHGGSVLAWSGPRLAADLKWAAKLTQKRQVQSILGLPPEITRLRMIGLRTCAVADPLQRGQLRGLHAKSGFFLAPMIAGFPSVCFKDWLPFSKPAEH